MSCEDPLSGSLLPRNKNTQIICSMLFRLAYTVAFNSSTSYARTGVTNAKQINNIRLAKTDVLLLFFITYFPLVHLVESKIVKVDLGMS